jgi:DNA topoisomerase-3
VGKTLYIAEKPSVARDIAAALGGFSKVDSWLESPDAAIASALGHLVEIYAPEAERAGRDLASLPVIPQRFTLRPIAKTHAQFNLLARLMRRSDVSQVVNACDAGREGELIFRLIYELAQCRKPMRRMWLQSMTREAIREAARDLRPGEDFDGLSDAARCRTEADWLIGINASRGITRLREQQSQRYEMLSAGRVQTPALAILVHRELAIRAFVPQDYWEIQATFRARAGTYVGKWFLPDRSAAQNDERADQGDRHRERLFDKTRVDAIVSQCRNAPPGVVTDQARIATRAPPRLFDLTGLQREANQRFRFSAKKTLDLAQVLYERHRLTTYPRTDSTALPEDYLEKAKTVIASLREGGAPYATHAMRVLDGDWVQPHKRIFDNSRISDHFAIIPTGGHATGLSDPEAKIYDLITRRFLAAFHPPVEHSVTTRLTQLAGQSFKTVGKVLLQPGWLLVQEDSTTEERLPTLCPIAPDETLRTESVESRATQTAPPPRHTEATWLAAMEGAGNEIEDEELREALRDRGLGTPATRASMIEGVLADRDGRGRVMEPYARREGKAQHLRPTNKGMEHIQFLERCGIQCLTTPRMTGEWEHRLHAVEKGECSRADFMADIVRLTTHIIDTLRQQARALPPPAHETLSSACPACGAPVVATARTFECTLNCGFKLLREVCRRTLSSAEGTQLLRDGTLSRLEGFVSLRGKTRRSFAAGLKLDIQQNRIALVYDGQAAEARGADGSSAAIATACPKCSDLVRLRGHSYECDRGDFKLQSTLAGRTLSVAEVERLIRDGHHPCLNGFTGRKGQKFAAGLRLSNDFSRVEFVFR